MFERNLVYFSPELFQLAILMIINVLYSHKVILLGQNTDISLFQLK